MVLRQQTDQAVINKIRELYDSLLRHNGFGEMRIEMRFLKKGQKEIIIHCGKQYRYVVDYPCQAGCAAGCALEEVEM